MTKTAAHRLDKQIRDQLDAMEAYSIELGELLREAKTGEAYKALGFDSWGAYLADLCKGRVHLSTTARRELVWTLYEEGEEGMSQRDIASVVGADQSQVCRDLSRLRQGDANASRGRNTAGHDGKSYQRKSKVEKLDGKLRKMAKRLSPTSLNCDTVLEAKRERIHQELGYNSWGSYLGDVFRGNTSSGEDRAEIAVTANLAGLSQDDIAALIDTPRFTIRRWLEPVRHDDITEKPGDIPHHARASNIKSWCNGDGFDDAYQELTRLLKAVTLNPTLGQVQKLRTLLTGTLSKLDENERKIRYATQNLQG